MDSATGIASMAEENVPLADTQLSTNGEPSSNSQTASEFINSQLQLEADAREALPYTFDRCTQPLGPLRQSVFSCLTCNPPPASPSDAYNPAGVCYSCSIACHGEHTLVELFNRRDFTCDCGTTRIPSASPCTLRINPVTGMKGLVHSQRPAEGNTYNHNFQNRFCGCGEWYDAQKQKGTMYQCLGLATEQNGGCGEDWWHPECILGLPRDWYQAEKENSTSHEDNPTAAPRTATVESADDQDHPVPPGFPHEDQIETLICYKCTNREPWIKRYAGSVGFLPPLYHRPGGESKVEDEKVQDSKSSIPITGNSELCNSHIPASRKRKSDEDYSDPESTSSKKLKVELRSPGVQKPPNPIECRKLTLPEPLTDPVSLIASNEDFRTRFCRCPECYPSLSKYPQLLEEEEDYEPPLSEDEDDAEGGGSVGTGSLLERGEAALSNVDRVRAIEGVMVYNHLKDKVKSFLQPFAESGQAVGAEDIKAYFEKLRGDAEVIRAAGGAAITAGDGKDGGGDNRREQSGY